MLNPVKWKTQRLYYPYNKARNKLVESHTVESHTDIHYFFVMGDSGELTSWRERLNKLNTKFDTL